MDCTIPLANVWENVLSNDRRLRIFASLTPKSDRSFMQVFTVSIRSMSKLEFDSLCNIQNPSPWTRVTSKALKTLWKNTWTSPGCLGWDAQIDILPTDLVCGTSSCQG